MAMIMAKEEMVAKCTSPDVMALCLRHKNWSQETLFYFWLCLKHVLCPETSHLTFSHFPHFPHLQSEANDTCLLHRDMVSIKLLMFVKCFEILCAIEVQSIIFMIVTSYIQEMYNHCYLQLWSWLDAEVAFFWISLPLKLLPIELLAFLKCERGWSVSREDCTVG